MTEKQSSLVKRNDADLEWANSYGPYIRALLLLVTGTTAGAITGNALAAGIITGTVDAALELMTHGIEKMRVERQRVFFDELATGEQYLSEKLIQEEDFLHDFFATYNAAMKTRERKKIRRFARLLLTATRENRIGSDEAQEFRSILLDLSSRELEILIILQKIEASYPRQLVDSNGTRQLENDLQYAKRIWDSFQSVVESKCGVQPQMFISILTRLVRTSLYEPITGTYWGYKGGQGQLTKRFSEFTRWIEIEADKS